MKKLCMILLSVLLILSLVTACGGNKGKETTGTTKAPETTAPAEQTTQAPTDEEETEAEFEGDVPLAQPVKVKIAGLLNANVTPYYVALEKGFFIERGLEVEFLIVNSGNEAAAALASGDVDMAFAALNNLQSAIASGVESNVGVSVITGNGGLEWYDTHLAMIAHRDSGIKTIADMKGKTLGTQLGGTSEVYAREALIDAGLDPDKDVNWVNLNNPDQLTAFINHNVDVISSSEPYNTQFMMEVPGSVELIRGGGYYTYASVNQFTRDYINQHPDVVLRVVTALAKAAHYTRNNPREAAEILSHWMTGSDVELLAESMKHVGFDPRITVNTIKAWDYALDTLIQQGKLQERIAPDNYMNTTFMNQVVEHHPEWFEDLNQAEFAQYTAR
jgi:sulfonate transport system substrate-binding protein